jgi:hypothetical protein
MRTSLILLALGGVALLPGCQTRGPYDPIASADGHPPHQLTHGVSMLDKKVRDAFLLINQAANRLPQGQIEATVTLQNRFKTDELFAETQFVFYDAHQMPVETGEWKTVHFPPQQLVLIKGNSLRADVCTYNIQFRNLTSPRGRPLPSTGTIYEAGCWVEGTLPQ